MQLNTTRIRRLIDRRQRTHTSIADEMGISRAALSKYLRGDSSPTLTTIRRIAKTLGVAGKSLITEDS